MRPGDRVIVKSEQQRHRFINGDVGDVLEASSRIVVIAVRGRRYPMMEHELQPIGEPRREPAAETSFG